jgi:uncharacterized membrane protein (Fun14 family)
MSAIVALGALGTTGFLVGYVVKKLTKLVIFLIGLFLLALVSLEYLGVIKICYDKLNVTPADALTSLQALMPKILPMLSGLFYSLSFGAGLVLGLMKG